MSLFPAPVKSPLQRLKEHRQRASRKLLRAACCAALIVGGFISALDYAEDKQFNVGVIAIASFMGAGVAAGTRALSNQPGSQEAIALAITALEEANFQQDRLSTSLLEHREYEGRAQRERIEFRKQIDGMASQLQRAEADNKELSGLVRELLSQMSDHSSQSAPRTQPTSSVPDEEPAELLKEDYWTQGLKTANGAN